MFLLDLKYIPLELECACAWSSSGSLSVHQSILIVHQSKYMVGNWRECRTLVLFWSQVCDTGQYICFVSCASISRWPLRINKKSINQGVCIRMVGNWLKCILADSTSCSSSVGTFKISASIIFGLVGNHQQWLSLLFLTTIQSSIGSKM